MKYSVILPIAGYVETEVEAESEREAIDAALAKEYTNEDIVEWSTYPALHEGNVSHVTYSEACADRIEPDKDSG